MLASTSRLGRVVLRPFSAAAQYTTGTTPPLPSSGAKPAEHPSSRATPSDSPLSTDSPQSSTSTSSSLDTSDATSAPSTPPPLDDPASLQLGDFRPLARRPLSARSARWKSAFELSEGALDPSRWSAESGASAQQTVVGRAVSNTASRGQKGPGLGKAVCASSPTRMDESSSRQTMSSKSPGAARLIHGRKPRRGKSVGLVQEPQPTEVVAAALSSKIRTVDRKMETTRRLSDALVRPPSWSGLTPRSRESRSRSFARRNDLDYALLETYLERVVAEYEKHLARKILLSESYAKALAKQANIREKAVAALAMMGIDAPPTPPFDTSLPPTGTTSTSPPLFTPSSLFVEDSASLPTRDLPPHSRVPADPRRGPPTLSSYSQFIATDLLLISNLKPSIPSPPIATLAHGLDRVLFNPGVHFLQDPRSGVYNFSPATLGNVPKIEDFDFSKLPQYVTSSKDEQLMALAAGAGKTFVGSTSTTVGMLCQIYFWLSKFQEVNTSMLSSEWQTESKQFTMGQRLPVSVILHFKDGRYSIDADKSIDLTSEQNILGQYGHLMEKLLTSEPDEFAGFVKGSKTPARSEADDRQAYYYTQTKHMVLRSQLDAQNEHLPNKTFDVKTRGSIAIRQDRQNYEAAAGYSVTKLRGTYNSFEREYYDLIRSAFLKYQFQARIGAMDGVIVAYHNTSEFFGFQYCPLPEMDEALFGSPRVGDNVFRTCVGMMEQILLEATKSSPGQSLSLTFAAASDRLRVFVEPYLPDVDFESRPVPTMYEYMATSFYLGPSPDRNPIPFAIGADIPSEAAYAPWTTGFTFERHSPDADILTKDLILRRLRDVREIQTTFNTIHLPAGVTEAAIVEAAVRANISGLEPDPSDLSVRFPLRDGITYTSRVSYMVKHLRKLASSGAGVKRRSVKRGRVVQLRTVVDVRST